MVITLICVRTNEQNVANLTSDLVVKSNEMQQILRHSKGNEEEITRMKTEMAFFHPIIQLVSDRLTTHLDEYVPFCVEPLMLMKIRAIPNMN